MALPRRFPFTDSTWWHLGHKSATFWGYSMVPRIIFILLLLKMAVLISISRKNDLILCLQNPQFPLISLNLAYFQEEAFNYTPKQCEIRRDLQQQYPMNCAKYSQEVNFLVSVLLLTESCGSDLCWNLLGVKMLQAKLWMSIMNGIICTTHQCRKNSTNNASKFSFCRCFSVSSWKWICALINLTLV